MKALAATGALILVLAGCSPTQQAYDPYQQYYRGRDVATATPPAPQPGQTPTWQKADGSHPWAPTEPARPTPLFGDKPLSPYSANAQVQLSASTSSATLASSASMKSMGPDITSASMPSPSPFQTLSAASRAGATPETGGMQQVRTDMPDNAVVAKATAKCGPTLAPAGPAMPATLPEPGPLPLDGPATCAVAPKKETKPADMLPLLEEKTTCAKSEEKPICGKCEEKSPCGKCEEKPICGKCEEKPICGKCEENSPCVKDDNGCMEKTATFAKTYVAAKLSPAHTGPNVRMVNSKRIQFNYKVEDNGQANVAAIDLWFTLDGHSWRKCDNVSMVRGACIAEVAEEGTYGFTLVARGNSGQAKEMPKPGDLPQVWVEVDLTAPQVSLKEVKPARGPKPDHVLISWSANDRNLARRPITLSYAETSTGPWTVIAANLENTGKHQWSLPASLPPKLLVKVEAADLVGNVGAAQSKEAVAFSTVPPAVSILDVEPAGVKNDD